MIHPYRVILSSKNTELLANCFVLTQNLTNINRRKDRNKEMENYRQIPSTKKQEAGKRAYLYIISPFIDFAFVYFFTTSLSTNHRC